MRILTLACALSICGAAAAAAPRPLSTDEQIREVFAGNTVSGKADGKSYIEFLSPDGKLLGEEPEGRYTGRWMAAKGQICFSYDLEEGRVTTWDCAQVEIDGTQLTWIDQGERSHATLAAGNPSRL
jgi:hypothetical protein